MTQKANRGCHNFHDHAITIISHYQCLSHQVFKYFQQLRSFETLEHIHEQQQCSINKIISKIGGNCPFCYHLRNHSNTLIIVQSYYAIIKWFQFIIDIILVHVINMFGIDRFDMYDSSCCYIDRLADKSACNMIAARATDMINQ